MRKIILFCLFCIALPVAAQTTRPKNLEPLPDPLPPPMIKADESLEPQVTIRKSGEDSVEEFRISGRLYMMKVTPRSGVPYYLIDHRGDGKFAREESLDSGMRPPMWVIHEF